MSEDFLQEVQVLFEECVKLNPEYEQNRQLAEYKISEINQKQQTRIEACAGRPGRIWYNQESNKETYFRYCLTFVPVIDYRNTSQVKRT
ncbi:MAG: hypothetical protein LBS53_01235, partial [Synergistaceae bacterium]|nr:hypothetical protein [Synergistaceae bacterium]